MNTLSLIDYIINLGIKLKLDSGKLKIIAPPDKLTPQLMQQIKSAKNEITELLSGMNKSAAIVPVEKKEYYHVSSAQKRLYILHQMDLGNTAYNMPQVISFDEGSEQAKVEDIFMKLIARHESLRTYFLMINEEIVQKIDEKVVLKIDRFQNQNEPLTPNRANEIRRNFIRPFDISKAPLLRVGVIKTHEGKYTFLLDMHHIISDGVSHGILVNDFLSLYEGENLAPLRIQYKDFSQWQNGDQEKEKIKHQEKYWLNEFTGEIPVLELPTDYPRPAEQSFEGNSVNFYITGEETQGLKMLSLKENSTLFMVLAAIFNVLIAKLSGQEDIVIGTLAAGRRHPGLDKIIGLFLNTLSLRNSPTGDLTFRTFLGNVKEKTLKAFENQEYPYEELVNKLSKRRDIGRNPLFDAMLILQNMNAVSMDQEKDTEIDNDEKRQHSSSNEYENIFQTAKLDLRLTAEERDRLLFFSFEYRAILFKKETIERYIIYFKKIISSTVKDPGIKISDIQIITEEEKKQILSDFNKTKSVYPVEKTIHRLFTEQVERTPHSIALIGDTFDEEASLSIRRVRHIQLSYRQLNEKSNRFSLEFQARGVNTDTIVGILLERSLEMPIVILAVLKAGGAYLPIDPNSPLERINYMLKDSGSKFSVSKDDLRELSLLPDSQLPNSYFSPAALRQRPSTSLAYVIYTSGSTGKPKGVMVEHIGMTNHIDAKVGILQISENSVVAQNASHTFDISVWQFFTAMIRGGRTVIYSDRVVLNPEHFVSRLLDDRITILEVVPSYLSVILGSVNDENGALLHLEYLLVTGEELKPHLVKQWFESYPRIKMVNAYGPTEASDDITHHIMNAVPDLDRIPIGKPVQNMKIYIVGNDMQLCPIGVKGEIWVSGIGVGRGYLNEVFKTYKAFPVNFRGFEPFTEGKVRLYKTGDIGRWLSGGSIEFLGRKDYQVKIHGFRIELGEIENHILNYPGIKEVVVIDRTEENGDKYLCAYIVSETEYGISELREYLSMELPDYMIPAYYVRLEQIPLTPNGKVDRKALPEVERSIGGSYIAPRDKVEKKLVKLWVEILARDASHASQLQLSLGINDNFFNLGGHSLNAMILISRIHKEFEVRVPLIEVFKRQTVIGLADYIRGSFEIEYVGINPVEKKEYYVLSPAQTRMYIVNQMYYQSTEYNMPSTLVLEGDIDTDRLFAAFNGVVKRHESLRTSFITVDEKPVQKIQKEVDFKLDYYDASEFGSGENPREKEKNNYLSSILRNFLRPFDLSKAPIMRSGLIKVKANEHILMIDTHHIITDAVSGEILTRDLIMLYAGEKLPPLKLRYKDFSEWRNTASQKEFLKKQKKYWIQKFKGEIPILNLPTDYERNGEAVNFEGNSLHFLVPPPVCQNLEDLTRQMEVTLFMLLLAIYNILIYHYTGQEDIVVGSPVTGRDHSDLYSIVGMFVNMLALRNQPQGRKTFKEFLLEVRQNVLDAFANQDYPFDELVKNLQIQRKSPQNPLFNIVLAMQNIDTSGSGKTFNANTNRLRLKPYQANTIISRFDLTMFVTEDNGHIRFLCRYPTNLFKENTIKKLGEHYIEIIEQVIKKPEIKLEEIILSSTLMPGSHTKQEDDVDFDF